MTSAPTLIARELQPGSGHRIPNAAYYEPAWLEREKSALFEKVWVFAGVVLDLPEPGHYLTRRVGRVPVVVLRDDDGRIRAFHNFCRHRGAQLLDGQGSCRTISCPYHAWNYGLDGSLRKVPQHRTEFKGMKLSDWPLLPVACEVFAGMIFVSVDPGVAPLAEWLGELGDYLGRYDIGALTEVQRYRHPLKSNWKFFVENHIDWLHLFYLHAKTLNMYDHAGGRWQQCGDHWMSFEVPDAKRGEQIAKQREGLLPIPGLETEGAYGAHLIFPNLPLVTSDRSFTTMEMVFDGPTECAIDIRLFAPPGSEVPESRKSENNAVMQEDSLAAERMQLAVSSPHTHAGPMALRYEEPVVDFHATYLKYLDAAR